MLLLPAFVCTQTFLGIIDSQSALVGGSHWLFYLAMPVIDLSFLCDKKNVGFMSCDVSS